MEKIWQQLKFGLKDYCCENGFTQVILGLSGGIDSALTAVLASDTLGGENVTAVMMKTQFTSDLSLQIARKISRINHLNYHELDIEPLVQNEINFLKHFFKNDVKEIVKENLQARIRGQLLMALSNQTGGLVLACGNKSESYTGYCTLYGDTCGGLAPIADIYKTMVFALAKWRNSISHSLPEEVITRAPSAELAIGQKDENILPPYAVLDRILTHLIDERKTAEEIIAIGFDDEIVKRVVSLVERSAFKRRQQAPTIPIKI